MLKAISRSLISAVFPLSCEICASPLSSRESGGLCIVCERSIPLLSNAYSENENLHFDRVFAACVYEEKVKELLCAFKFRRRRVLKSGLVRLLERRLSGQDSSRWDALAAVPMPTSQKLERGYNQADLLAGGVAKTIGKPFLKNALSLAAPVKQQAKLSKTQRRENVKHAFRAKTDVAGKNILLVDDIFTTGETASECARALKQAGAKIVDVLVVARGR